MESRKVHTGSQDAESQLGILVNGLQHFAHQAVIGPRARDIDDVFHTFPWTRILQLYDPSEKVRMAAS